MVLVQQDWTALKWCFRERLCHLCDWRFFVTLLNDSMLTFARRSLLLLCELYESIGETPFFLVSEWRLLFSGRRRVRR